MTFNPNENVGTVFRSGVVGAAGVSQGTHQESEFKRYRLGTKLQIGTRVFHYAQAGAALDQGYLLETAALGGATTTEQASLAIAVAAVVGDRKLSVTTLTTSQTANKFEDGFVTIVHGSNANGAGTTFEIKSHPALTHTATGVLTLWDEVAKAITTGCKASITANLYKGVVQTPVTTPLGTSAGVSLCDVQSSYYFWCQTWGPVGLLTGSEVVVDSSIIRGVEVGESDILQATGNAQDITDVIGISIQIGSDGMFPLMHLMLAP